MNNINAIKFLSEGTSIISLIKKSDFLTDYNVSLEYSYNGTDWSVWDLSGLIINQGETLYIRGNNLNSFSCWNEDTEAYYTFIIEGDKVSCSGNIMSLIDYENLPDAIPCDFCFYGLFSGCTALTTAPELPATELTDRCYYQMFYGCTSLTTAPELPAKNLAERCYDGMFSGCISLITAPELPATELADGCYYQMFSGCTSLTTAPKLPAKTLKKWCYSRMFSGCTSLTSAPELPTMALAEWYYFQIFNGCTFLKDKK